MFKKLLIVLFAGGSLISFGCMAKEVTADMLIGKWKCEADGKVAYYDKEGKLGEYVEPEHESLIVMYTKDANVDRQDADEVFLLGDDFKAKEQKSTVLDGEKISGDSEYVYVSDNKIKLIINMKSEGSYLSHTEGVCTRITK